MQLPDPDERMAQYVDNSLINNDSESLTNIHILQICQARLGPGAYSTNPNVSGYTIRIATHGILHETALGLDPALRSLMQVSDCYMTSFWIPGSILRSALPNLVKRFKGKKVVPPVENYPPVRFQFLVLLDHKTQTKDLQILTSLALPPPHTHTTFRLVS